MVRFSVLLIFSVLSGHVLPAQKFAKWQKGLILDLNADTGVVVADSGKVESWTNLAPGAVMTVFEKRDEGREVAGSGRPELKKDIAGLNGHNSIAFLKQELLNKDEDACDHLIRGQGFTWIAVVKVYTQIGLLKDVNAIFGNLRNGGNYEGFWAGLTDDNRLWAGARNGITFGRWDNNNPLIIAPRALDSSRYYLIAGRLAAGADKVPMDIFIDRLEEPVITGVFPVNSAADASMLSIGQERDAVQHPGVESFRGEIARLLIYERPLNKAEMRRLEKMIRNIYRLP